MRKIFIIMFFVFLTHSNTLASSAQELVLESANSLQLLLKSNQQIPTAVLKSARAVVVVPKSIKVSFFLGAKYGEGIASIKKANNQWSQPFFIKLGGGSLGVQFGIESAHTLFIFRTANSVEELLSEKFTLGAGASLSAGPLSKNYERNTEIDMSAEIFTYSKTGGLFAGASLKGAMISHYNERNSELYSKEISAKEILSLDSHSDIYSVEQFLNELNSVTK